MVLMIIRHHIHDSQDIYITSFNSLCRYLLCQMTKPPHELHPWVHDVIKSLEESLFKHASSKVLFLFVVFMETREVGAVADPRFLFG